MILRVWHGYTSPENATAYETLLTGEIMPAITARKVPGFRGMSLARRTTGDEVEFVTLMRFDSIDAVRAFAGDDYETAVVPTKARQVLKRYDARSQHYAIVQETSPAS